MVNNNNNNGTKKIMILTMKIVTMEITILINV